MLLGFVNVFDKPARQTFVLEMVGREDLPNAVSLNSVVDEQLARSSARRSGGVLIALVGLSPCFYINAASYVAVLVALWMMDASKLQPVPRVPRAKGQFREGFRYVWSEPLRAHAAADDGGDRHARVQLPGRDPAASRPKTFDMGAGGFGALAVGDGCGRRDRRARGRVAQGCLVPAPDRRSRSRWA